MNIQEAAAYTKKGTSTIRRYIKNGKLKVNQVGNRYEIEKEELDRVFNVQNMDNQLFELIETLQNELEEKNKQLHEKDKQIEQIHQLLAIAETNNQRLIFDNQKLLVDLRHKQQPFWKRLFSKTPPSPITEA